jgi:hypothetical protein
MTSLASALHRVRQDLHASDIVETDGRHGKQPSRLALDRIIT